MSSLSITIIQTDIEWENKAINLQKLEKKINSISGKTEIVLLPEMFSTGFSMETTQLAETMDGTTVQWMKEIAARKKIIIAGSLIIEDKGYFYNRLIWMLPNGQRGYYDKRHLFGLAHEDQFYSAGNKRLIASVKGWKINLQVCYDLRFPVWARNRIMEDDKKFEQGEDKEAAAEEITGRSPEYDVLIYVANWPEKRRHAWKTLLAARAIENQCYVVGVNRVGHDANNLSYSGDSLVLDPMGEILYHAADKEEVYTITLQKETLEEVRNKLPFWKDGDSFNFQ